MITAKELKAMSISELKVRQYENFVSAGKLNAQLKEKQDEVQVFQDEIVKREAVVAKPKK